MDYLCGSWIICVGHGCNGWWSGGRWCMMFAGWRGGLCCCCWCGSGGGDEARRRGRAGGR